MINLEIFILAHQIIYLGINSQVKSFQIRTGKKQLAYIE